MKYVIKPAYVNGQRVMPSERQLMSDLPDCVWTEAINFAQWIGQDALVTDEDGRSWIL